MTFWGIVVAAGAGRRFGRSKHDLLLDGRPLWLWARDCLAAAGAARVLVVGDVPGGLPGGARRRDSVAAGLAEVPAGVDHVLIHDAARPLASPDLARRVAARLGGSDVAGVVPVVPVRDTLKRVSGDLVTETVDRSDLVSVQTPQGFATGPLRDAHAVQAGDAVDDAVLVERAGGRIATVPGEPANLKVTYADDLALLAALLAR